MTLGHLTHVDVAFPAPAMCGDFVAVRNCFGSDPRRRCDSPPACVESSANAANTERVADPRPAGARAILEMALHTKIARALDRFDSLVHMLVTFIAFEINCDASFQPK